MTELWGVLVALWDLLCVLWPIPMFKLGVGGIAFMILIMWGTSRDK